MPELLAPCLLTPEHDRSQFQCGRAEFDDWLRRYASQNRHGNTAATWVVADAEGRVAAYATLSAFAVDRAAAPDALSRRSPDPVPALLIGRLAVDQRHAGRRLGSRLATHLLRHAGSLNVSAAFKAVVVTAVDERARAWWERLGFEPFIAGASCLDLFLLTKDLVLTTDGS